MPLPFQESISLENVHQVVKMELSKMTFTDLFKCMECSTTISTGKILQRINGYIFFEWCSGTLNNCQVCGRVPLTIPCHAIESLRQLLNDSMLQFTRAQPATNDSIETELDVVVKMELSKMTFTDLFKCMECSTTISTGKILQVVKMELSEMTFTYLFKCMECGTTISTGKILQAVKMELSKMTFTDLFKCMGCSTTISTGKILQCIDGHIFCERRSRILSNCQVCCNFRAFPCPFVALSQCSSHSGSAETEDHLVNAHGAVYSKEVPYKAELVIRKGSISPDCMTFNCFGKLFMLSVVRFPSPEDGVPVFLVYVQFFGDECKAKMYFCSPRTVKEAGEDHSTESFKSILCDNGFC